MGYGLIKEDTLSDIADAIRTKNELDVTYKPSEMAAAIAALNASSSDSSTSSEGVDFLDHDGTVLYSYTWDEVAELTELPDLPTWTAETVGGFSIPMTCTGWNRTLSNIQSRAEGFMQVGALYEPTDGKTHMIIWMDEGGDIELRLTCSVADAAVIIDWGDGNTTETTATDATNYEHDYGNETSTYYDLTITANNGTASFTQETIYQNSVGKIYNCLKDKLTLQELYIGAGITSLGDYAFYSCRSLTSITLPDSLTSIGYTAFSSCYSLASITFPSSLTSIGYAAFSSCYSLTSITLPDSLTSLGNHAFSSCHSLASITLPDSLTSLGDYAFSYCYNLTSVALPNRLTSIGTHAFQYCHSLASITLPDSLTSLGDYAFQYCYSLASITFPSSLTSIGYAAFSSCYSLTSITLPDSLTSLGDHAFSYCYNLTSVALPDSLTSIGISGFWGSGLTSITLPDSLTSIGSYVFSNCKKLSSITIGDNLTSVKTSGYSYCSAFYYCYSLKSIALPDSLTSVGSYMFYECDSLASITLPGSLTSIEAYAFYRCYSLMSITLPDSLTSIGAYAFSASGIVTLDGLYISSSDTATNTFETCSYLTHLTNVREINATLYLGESPLTYDSAINLFNGLSEENTGTVTLSSTTYALLDEDDLAIATDKGWTVASA